MGNFHNAVGLQVVCGDSDVDDAIFLAEVLQSGDHWRTIIRDEYLGDATPAAKDLLKDELSNRLAGLRSKNTEFWPVREATTSLDDVLITIRFRHVHSVNVTLLEETAGRRDPWW